MKQSYRIIPVYTGDVSGVCSALYELGGMVVIHDPSGCNSTYNTHDETRWYEQDSLIFISGLSERDAVLGNDKKLIDDIVCTAKELQPAFIALTNSPIPFMNGTDFYAIAKIIEKKTKIPAFFVPANGMHDYTYGASNAFAKLIDYMKPNCSACGTTPEEKKLRVNILGATPLDFMEKGFGDRIEKLLCENSFTLVSNFGMGVGVNNWQQAATADVNLVLSSTGMALAKKMEEAFQIPYVVGTPIGRFCECLWEALKEVAGTNTSVIAYKKNMPAIENPIQMILIGEAVTMKSLAKAVQLECGLLPHVVCPLEEWEAYLDENDWHTDGEEEIEALLQQLVDEEKKQNTLIVVADPLYRPIIPDGVTFVPLMHQAFSGRCYQKEQKPLVGISSDSLRYVMRYLAT